jgi:CRISPR system Cascade subunit CasC
MNIEIHILQNFAPSNLNRDDTGNPKDTEFGGVRRARISSQCIKRAIRMHPVFEQTTQVKNADRTRWITRLLVKPLMEAGKTEEQAWTVAEAFTNAMKIGTEKDKSAGQARSTVLLYLSKGEIREICDKLTAQWDGIVSSLKDGKSPALDKLAGEAARQFKDRTSAPDIALFGRMLAERPELNIDAACQVAHAISTHRVNMEMDFYTAVDDLATDEETGAGMMGVTAFNSACFYRYACLNYEQLVKNLDDNHTLARKTVEGFLRAAALAVPTGKQNSFAAYNPPDFLLGVVRRDGQAWSLVNAFEKAIRPSRDGGIVEASIAALDRYWGRLAQVYGDQNLKSVALAVNEEAALTALKDVKVNDFEVWVEKLLEGIPGG